MNYRILFVCTGNICRSPTAEGVLRHKLHQAGLHHVGVASAGTHGYHAGEAPDPRSIAHAQKRGYDISSQRAQKLQANDFMDYDLILALDYSHLEYLRAMQPKNSRAKIALFLGDKDVPDPYYGGAKGFEEVLDLIEDGAEKLLASIQSIVV